MEKLDLMLWDVQYLVSLKLEDIACWLLRLSNRVYNWRISKEAQFPEEFVIDAFKQKYEAYISEEQDKATSGKKRKRNTQFLKITFLVILRYLSMVDP